MLPGADGFELCRQIRQTPTLSSIPVIFLTAKTAEADRVKGLELGGDDYITKPFSPRELVARVRSVLRGLRKPPVTPEVLRVGDLEIDASSMTVRVQGRAVLTTVREFRLLEYLAIAPRACADARPVARCGMERDSLRDAALHRRLRAAAAGKNRSRSSPPEVSEDVARHWLSIRIAQVVRLCRGVSKPPHFPHWGCLGSPLTSALTSALPARL